MKVSRRVIAIIVAVLLVAYIAFTEVRIDTLYNINWQAIQRVNLAEKKLLDYDDRFGITLEP